jgi:hypothetical protein
MPHKKHLVTLTPEERQQLRKLVSAGKRSARTSRFDPRAQQMGAWSHAGRNAGREVLHRPRASGGNRLGFRVY